ncbi:MAG: DEAD/DEAH box helicase family protein [Proteobacteria bacterium]|nr:DEAD/DEAH box helicase family protein [Pseudomonadota bacterium]MBU1456628.1 DEAD/DEAH box helicase family protein [Pseudomonadota bacterium]
MNNERLVPVIECWVKKIGVNSPGVVRNISTVTGNIECQVDWLQPKRSENVPVDQLRSGFLIGMEVQDVPSSRTGKSLGEGVVVETRTLGCRDQVLVEFPERGDRFWLPFENLKQIKGVQQRFELRQTGQPGNAEHFRLRSLAHAIEMWHENTGSLSHLNIDPLPHQIHLVHHILASGNLNWMIADDVGLGKTIEVGMLLSALIRRGTIRRILLVTPAGLVNQWKEELHHKFGLSDFQVYGEDFHVHEPRHWKLYDFVIGSMDKFKSESHLENLTQAGTWDLIVFDEAHRLSRAQYGMKFQSSERFRLAASLRKTSDSMLLLTATPHQGKQDKFQALLELIRPELKKEIRTLALNPDILRRMVIRNHKADVTDAAGAFIFQGKLTSTIPVSSSPAEDDFDKELQKYLREGYVASRKSNGMRGRAIGFVMATYRKLAASSIAAIERSLSRRLQRLENGDFVEPSLDEEQVDERFVGEWEESVDVPGGQFFDGEIVILKELIAKARLLFTKDSKLQTFIDELVETILRENSKEKILVFTEYRGTQDFLTEALQRRFGNEAVSLLHGGLSHLEREEAIINFEDLSQFLISTEAGGEGINLQRECHIMVNYDLPWNPMRLVQRVGRLYRYGQKNKVVVFNISVPQSMDGNILNILYQRIGKVVEDMAILGGEFRPGLEAEILGELVEALNVSDVLDQSRQDTVPQTRKKIDEALQRAKEAVEKQRELLEYAAGYNPEESAGELAITLEHVDSFIKGVMEILDIKVLKTTHKGKVMRIALPDDVAEAIGVTGRQMKITLDRDIASRRKDVQMMDLTSSLLLYLLKHVKDYHFDGRVAKLKELSPAVVTAMLRWQSDQGVRMRQEYTSFLVNEDGSIESNSDSFSKWLLHTVEDGDNIPDRSTAKKYFSAVSKAMQGRLGEISNSDLHPENCQVISGGYS